MDRREGPSFMGWLGLTSLFAAWVFLIHGHLLDGWWYRDDAGILSFVQRYSPWEWLSSPEVWREGSATHFTPLLMLSYEIDLALFGLSPTAFYAHTLVMLTLLLLAGFALLRRWLGSGWALATVLIFAMTTPVLLEMHGVLRRHYVDGLLFALIAAQLYVSAVRENRPGRALLGALACLLAVLNKELYIPLAAVLPWLPVGTPRKRWLFVVPFALVTLLGLLWRRAMLGVAVGGTGRAFDVDALLQTPARIVRLTFGGGLLGSAAGVLATALVLSFLLRRPRARMAFLVAAVGAVAPLMFVLPIGTAKLLLVVVWLLLMTALAELSALDARGGPARLAALVGVLLLGVAAGKASLSTHPVLHAERRAFEVTGRFVMEAEASSVIWTNLPDSYPRSLSELRETPSPHWVSDELMLSEVDLEGRTVVEYDASIDALRDVTAEVAERMEAWRAAVQTRPLSVDMVVRDGLVHWRFGPWKHGSWRIVEHDRFGTHDVGPSGSGRVNLSEALDFHIRYDSPEGWTSYSDRLNFRLTEGEQLAWQREAPSPDAR